MPSREPYALRSISPMPASSIVIAMISLQNQRLPALRENGLCGFPCFLLMSAIVASHVVPGLGRLHCSCSADARAGVGHERRLGHGIPSFHPRDCVTVNSLAASPLDPHVLLRFSARPIQLPVSTLVLDTCPHCVMRSIHPSNPWSQVSAGFLAITRRSVGILPVGHRQKLHLGPLLRPRCEMGRARIGIT